MTYGEQYEEPVFDLDTAIAKESFFKDAGNTQVWEAACVRLCACVCAEGCCACVQACGDIEEGFAASAHTLEDRIRIGAQAHFYMEKHCSYARLEEGGGVRVYCSNQVRRAAAPHRTCP